MDPSMMSSTSAATTVPPSTKTVAGCPLRTVGVRDAVHLLGHVAAENRELRYGPTTGAHGGAGGLAAAVGSRPPRIGEEHGEETGQVPGRAGHEEAIRQRPTLAQVGVEALSPLIHPPPRPRPQPAARGRKCAPERAADLLERVPPHVVQQVEVARSSGASTSSSTRSPAQASPPAPGRRLLLHHHRLGKPRTRRGDAMVLADPVGYLETRRVTAGTREAWDRIPNCTAPPRGSQRMEGSLDDVLASSPPPPW